MTDIVVPSTGETAQTLRLIRGLFRKRWRLVVLAAVCGAAIGYVLTFAVPPTYWAKATFYVTPPISSSAIDAVAGDQYVQERTQLYWQLAKSDELARRVASEMHPAESPAALVKRISVRSMHDVPLLTIEATGRSADAARSLAQGYVDQLPDYAGSIEQNSGLREGPVLITVSGPIEVTRSTAGVKPWLKLLLFSALLGGAALIYSLLERRRHPTVRSLGQLRKTVPGPWVVQVDGSPGELARIQAMLFAARNSARKVIVAGARNDDGLAEMIADVAAAFQEDQYESRPTHLLARARRISGPGSQLKDVEVFAAPALLDQHERIKALAARSSSGIMISAISSVIVCLKGQTLLEDVADLVKLLSLNEIEVKGILMARYRWQKRAKQLFSMSVIGNNTDEARPRTDVIEFGRPSGNGDGTL